MKETLSVGQKERKKKYDAKYYKENKEYFANATRKYANANKDKIREKAKKVYHKDKTKGKVRANTNHQNEKTGQCFDCLMGKDTEFHHLSYEPNIFIELCKICHDKRHGRNYYGR